MKNEPSKEIFEYIRRNIGGKKLKVGVILGVAPKQNIVKIGWSKCNLKAGDQFDTLLGLQRALNRAMKPDNVPTPACIRKQYRRFCSRAARYFKDAKTISIA